jgi:NAD(P)-dependent dehydrogenase (short-subunit alcohol dehydrogenase family)
MTDKAEGCSARKAGPVFWPQDAKSGGFSVQGRLPCCPGQGRHGAVLSPAGHQSITYQIHAGPVCKQVFLVDGAGSRGEATPGNAAYGASKAGLAQLRKTLAAEVKGTNVSVHLMSPGKLGILGLQVLSQGV